MKPATYVTGAPRFLLRFEGALVLLLSLALFHRTGAGWGLFAALLLIPDLSMLGYLANPRLGASLYNAVHTYIGPLALALLSATAGLSGIHAFVLIWTAHIGMDRALGYGLKYPTAFGDTHLGAIGRSSRVGSAP